MLELDQAAVRLLSPVGEVLPRLLEEIGLTPKRFGLLALMERELEKVSHHAKIVGFSQDKFFVEVESTVELYELNFRKEEILKAVRHAFSEKFSHPSLEVRFFLKGTERSYVQKSKSFKTATPKAPALAYVKNRRRRGKT